MKHFKLDVSDVNDLHTLVAWEPLQGRVGLQCGLPHGSATHKSVRQVPGHLAPIGGDKSHERSLRGWPGLDYLDTDYLAWPGHRLSGLASNLAPGRQAGTLFGTRQAGTLVGIRQAGKFL